MEKVKKIENRVQRNPKEVGESLVTMVQMIFERKNITYNLSN